MQTPRRVTLYTQMLVSMDGQACSPRLTILKYKVRQLLQITQLLMLVGYLRGSQLNWAALTKEAYAIYMSVKKLSFYLTDATVLLKSDHLPLRKFLQKNTLNNKVNNWAMELEAFNIKFQHVSGKANILADTLSRLVDIDPNARLDPENAGWEFGYYVFETLPTLSSQNTIQVCEVLSGDNVVRPDPDLQEPFIEQLTSPLTLEQLQALQAQDEKCTTLADMLR